MRKKKKVRKNWRGREGRRRQRVWALRPCNSEKPVWQPEGKAPAARRFQKKKKNIRLRQYKNHFRWKNWDLTKKTIRNKRKIRRPPRFSGGGRVAVKDEKRTIKNIRVLAGKNYGQAGLRTGAKSSRPSKGGQCSGKVWRVMFGDRRNTKRKGPKGTEKNKHLKRWKNGAGRGVLEREVNGLSSTSPKLQKSCREREEEKNGAKGWGNNR